MAKKVITLQKFISGLNNASSYRDIDISEFSYIKNAIVNQIGRIEYLGVFTEYTDLFTITDSIDIVNGYGLYSFGLDVDKDGNSNETYYLVVAGDKSGTKTFYIYDENGNKISSDLNGTSTDNIPVSTAGISSFKPLSFTVDGNTRLMNGDVSQFDYITNKWFGYVDNKFFDLTNGASGSGGNVTGFFQENLEIEKPVEGSGGNKVYTADISSSTSSSNPVYDGDIRIELQETSTSSTDGWSQGDLDNFFVTYLYSDGQESMPTFVYGNLEGISKHGGFSNWTNTNVKLKLNILVNPPISNSRINGLRIYTDSGTEGYLYLLATVSFKYGIKSYDKESYTGQWSDNTSGVSICSLTVDAKPNADTYESLTGIQNYTLSSTNPKVYYATNVVANRINYIGNVVFKGPVDKSILSSIETNMYPDSIFKSYVNKFDTFTVDRRLDIAINDGEKIIKLESFADRLLEFKENTLYIINISQQIEFLESVEKFKGVKYPYHVIHTEYGIVWINDYGMYLYNGKEVIDLLFYKNFRRISLDYWKSIYKDSKTNLSYDSVNKRIFIISDSTIQTQSALVFDFNLFAFTTSDSIVELDSGALYSVSNTISDWNNVAMFAASVDGSVTLYRFSKSAYNDLSRNIEIDFKDIVFENVELDKNIYKVLVSWNPVSSDTSLSIAYSKDGGSTATYIGTLTGSTNGHIETTFEFSSILKNVKSFQLIVTGSVDVDFYINDISIVYRPKGVH